MASVIGRQFLVRLLARVAGLSERLDGLLRELQALEIIYAQGLVPEPVYMFKHAVIQDVAYQSLLMQRRKALHRAVGEAIEALYPDRLEEHYAELAHHFTQGEVWDKAAVYCRRAGEKAMAQSAYREAVGYFEQALRTLPHLPETRDMHEQAIDLRLALRTALFPLGEMERILVTLQEAEALAETLGDQHRLGWVLAFLLAHLAFAGASDRALVPGQRALAIATTLGEVGLIVIAQLYLGHVYRNLGDYRQAVECFQRNVAALQGELLQAHFGLPALASVCSRSFLVDNLTECGVFAEGHAHAAEAVRIAEAADHPFSRVLAYQSADYRVLCQGDLRHAIPMLARALALAQGVQLRVLVPMAAASLGAAYALVGRMAEALPLLEQAVEEDAAMRHRFCHALRVTWLSEAYLLAGRLDEADTQAQRALEFSRAHQERGHEAYALRLLGEIAIHRDPPDIDQAEAHYRQALALAEELGMRPLQAHCHRGLGMLYAATGQQEQARVELATALEMYRGMEMTFWLPETAAALAQVDA
jgi:tetratricopeptide (TPR) repeat protein